MIEKNKKTLPPRAGRQGQRIFVIASTSLPHKNKYSQHINHNHGHQLRVLKLALMVKRWRS